MHTTYRLVLLVTVSLLLVTGLAFAQNGQPTREQRWHAITDGAYAFDLYCAQCHGTSGKGDGPMASRLQTKVPDLRFLATRTGRVDRSSILEHIYATNMTKRAPMPAWGAALRAGTERSDAYALLAAHNLARHVESLQAVQARR
jgi:mono/diheme cytochrome c family protein